MKPHSTLKTSAIRIRKEADPSLIAVRNFLATTPFPIDTPQVRRCRSSGLPGALFYSLLYSVHTSSYSKGMTNEASNLRDPSSSPHTRSSGSRQRLIDAMAELLWEKGYAATSPRDVMSAASVGQGSFYHHFSGKHELAVAALRQNIAETLEDSAGIEASSPLEELKAYLLRPRPGLKGCRVGRMTQDPKVLQDQELLGLVEDAFTATAQRWERLIGAAVDAGELPRTLDPQQLARTLAAVLQGGYVLSRAYGSQQPMDDAVGGMASLLDSLAQSQRNFMATTSFMATTNKE